MGLRDLFSRTGPGPDGDELVADGLGLDDEMDDFDDFDDFDDDLDGEFGGDGGDGDFGGDDFGDDDFGDDDFGDDDFGDFGGGGSNEAVAELEDRVGELENEVSSISSGMSTVREENKQIGETVDEIDDTIRKLLDIYEMVTRGINPFVDDAQAMGGLEAGGAFGLFETEEETGGGAEGGLDGDVATADAETFFDDDFGDLDAQDGAEEAELAAEDELTGEQRADPAEALDDPDPDETLDDPDDDDVEADDASDGGGASFADLKSEYEEGDGKWGDGTGDEDGEGLDDPDAEAALDEEVGDDWEGAVEEGAEDGGDDTGDEGAEERVEEFLDGTDAEAEGSGTVAGLDGDGAGAADGDSASGGDATDDAASVESDAEPVETDQTMFNEGGTGDRSPYLASLPASYITEYLVLEWTQNLVDEGGVVGAARALRQYEELRWISTPVRSDLNEYLEGVSADAEAFGANPLGVEAHSRSLTYISRLAGDLTWADDPGVALGDGLAREREIRTALRAVMEGRIDGDRAGNGGATAHRPPEEALAETDGGHGGRHDGLRR